MSRTLVGIVGAPNKGKSTLFSAMTLASADIADYPFTTIKPNHGIAYAVRECVERELHVKCNARNSLCINGIRMIPVDIVDVAGLVPGAHLGKGMGNQFLSDIASANILIQVVDASGKTDIEGNRAENASQLEEIRMVEEELSRWLADIISRHMQKLRKSDDCAKGISEILTGFGVSEYEIKKAAESNSLSLSKINWNAAETLKFSAQLLKICKPLVIAANKIDSASKEEIKKIHTELEGYTVIECSGMIELALRRAAKDAKISYSPGSRSFEITSDVDAQQKAGLEYIKRFLGERSTGVGELINEAVFKKEDNIVVYPVEDEGKYTDHFGNVLPDAIIMKGGSTVTDFAMKIHTDIAKNMLYAIDAKRKIRIAKDYKLKDNDVIKIVSAAK